MRRARLVVISAAVIVGIAGGFASVFRVAIVSGNSMAPTFHDGQVVFALHPRWAPARPPRGAVVLVRHGDDVLVKRIAYIPGDIIGPTEAEAFEHVSLFFEKAPGLDRTGRSLRVPPQQVVVMGDNRPASDDSRSFGPVAALDIIGYVLRDPGKR